MFVCVVLIKLITRCFHLPGSSYTVVMPLLFVQRTSQVAMGGASMRKELFGDEPVTSEDHVSQYHIYSKREVATCLLLGSKFNHVGALLLKVGR